MGSQSFMKLSPDPSHPMALHDTIGPHSKKGLWAQTENLIKFSLLLFEKYQFIRAEILDIPWQAVYDMMSPNHDSSVSNTTVKPLI